MDNDKKQRSQLLNVLLKITRVFLTVYILMCLGVYFYQGSLVFVPTVGDPHKTPEEIGLKFEDLILESEEEKIHAWYVPAEEDKGTVLFCHGNAGNLGHRLSTIRIWNQLGLNILLFDYQGFGKSSGSPSEEACYEDVEACYKWLEENGKLSKPFIIHGRSLGGGVASWAAINFSCDALILESTFTSIPDMGAHYYPFLPISLISSISFNTEERLKDFNKPLLILHGKSDEIIPFEMGLKMAGQKHSDFLEMQGGHNDGFLVTPKYIPTLESFVEKLRVSLLRLPSKP